MASTAVETPAMECAPVKSSKRAWTGEVVLPEMPSVKVVIASPNDYPATIIGAEVTIVRTLIRTKVRTRTNPNAVLTGASTQQKNRDRAAGQKKLSACAHKI